ncbi:MAG: hypothetical protein MdMp014T_0704 [Treponematales bacterium]
MLKKRMKIEKTALPLTAAGGLTGEAMIALALLCAAALALGACGPGSVIYGRPDSLNVGEKDAAPFGSGLVYEEDELGGVYIIPNGAEVTVTGSTISDGAVSLDTTGNANRLRVADYASAAVTFESVVIDLSAAGWELWELQNMDPSAFPIPLEVGKGAILTLKLDGTNTLKGGAGGAGIYVPEDATLIITSAAGDGETTGVLNACGGGGGAGIGSNWEGSVSVGEIQIAGGTIYAMGDIGNPPAHYGHAGAAGIGGGAGSPGNDGGTVIITGGIVYAVGWDNAAGIGGGRLGKSGSVTINSPTGTSSGIAEAKVGDIGIQPGYGVGCSSTGESSGAFTDGSEGEGAYEYDANGWPTSAVYSWGNY